MKLKIMTYNVQHCYNQSLKDIDYDELALEIKNSNADIVGLNEIYGEGSIFGNQVEILAKKSGMNYCAFAAAFEHDYGPYGNGLLSKLPIRFVEKIMIPDPVIKANPEEYYETRCILKVTFDDGIIVLVSHFGLNDDEQKNAVATTLSNICNNKSILMGDFNMTPDNIMLESIKEHMNDTSIGFCELVNTWASYSPVIKIDYIFVSKDISVENAEVSSKIVSDHFYHSAVINIKK